MPTFVEVILECLQVLKFFPYPNIATANFCFQWLTGILFFYFVFSYLYAATVALFLASWFILATVYNTIWYHRYCSHESFTFANPLYIRLFLWTNPLALIFREEVYAIPHRNHHARTEQAEDPYGPHLGWFASFMAPELTQRLNKNLSQQEFDLLKARVRGIGFRGNTFSNFRKSGSIESPRYYFVRAIFAQFFWVAILFISGGISYVLSWYAAIFTITCLIRDFNWRGHGGKKHRPKRPGWEFDEKSYALNQHFYGYLAGEWHDNHHKYPFSANNGFLPGQIDVAFFLIKLMHRIGIVESYIDAKPLFDKECLGLSSSVKP